MNLSILNYSPQLGVRRQTLLLAMMMSFAVFACSAETETARRSTEAGLENNRTIVRRLFEEVMTRGSLAVVDDLLSTGYIDHAGGPSGILGYKNTVANLRVGLPDLKMSVDDLVAEKDRVVARFTARGTHKGFLFGFAPTGRSVEFSGITVFLIKERKITERWSQSDIPNLIRQIAPPPSQPPGPLDGEPPDSLFVTKPSEPADSDAVAAAPLGSKDNPVRCFKPSGQRDYLHRLLCPDFATPSISRGGSVGEGPYGTTLDVYQVRCSDGGPTVDVYMDMYHRDHVEMHPIPRFQILGISGK